MDGGGGGRGEIKIYKHKYTSMIASIKEEQDAVSVLLLKYSDAIHYMSNCRERTQMERSGERFVSSLYVYIMHRV